MNFLHRQCITERKLNFDTDYKSGQKRLQIGAGSEITKRGKSVTKRGRDYKAGQKDYKSGQGLQIGGEEHVKRKA